jgi:hypothetical protein
MIEVKPVDKTFGVFVNGWLLGTTKLQCDAQMHAYKLEEALAGTQDNQDPRREIHPQVR